eukprot:355427-Chlamydomonas_euryale.AAC.2
MQRGWRGTRLVAQLRVDAFTLVQVVLQDAHANRKDGAGGRADLRARQKAARMMGGVRDCVGEGT